MFVQPAAVHPLSPPAQGPLFFKDYTRYTARERMKAWDQRFSALVHMPQASSVGLPLPGALPAAEHLSASACPAHVGSSFS